MLALGVITTDTASRVREHKMKGFRLPYSAALSNPKTQG